MVCLLEVVAIALVCVPTILATLLLVEVAMTLVPRRAPRSPSFAPSSKRPSVAVLVPAHNESKGILPTLEDIRKQLLPGDRMLVVADSCSDDTAAMASAAGAEVIERLDSVRRGKGYALEFGVQHLSTAPTEVVVIIDADCRVAPGSIEQLALSCATSDRPAQALDLMISAPQSPVNHQVAELAWRVRNWVRPIGLHRVGLPCHLMGTGMAFPWRVLRQAKLGSENLAEDLALGLELAAKGYSTTFCPSARVTSSFPASVEGTHTQRKRWEVGHLYLIRTKAMKLIARAIGRGDWRLLVLVLDLSIPPLSLLGVLLLGSLALSGLTMLVGAGGTTLLISMMGMSSLVLALVLAWYGFGRDIMPLRAFRKLPGYAWTKLQLYVDIALHGKGTRWVRTDRK